MPRSLAACRSVCKAWCNVVDAHGLLRKDLLPLSLAGIFVVYGFVDDMHLPPAFLSRPSFVGKIQGNLGYLDDVHDSWSHMTGHCNGLLLLWEAWPIRPHDSGYENQAELVPANPNSEWPPSPYIISAFSSETWRWEQRSFVREGTAPRSIDPKLLPLMKDVFSHDAVYWRGRLYVYNIFFIIRLDLEDNKYRVIQLPPTINEAPGDILPHLGKSEKGVYYGFTHSNWCNFQVWFLNESIDHTEWMLKLEIDLKPLLENFPWEHSHGSWFVQGVRDYDDETLDEEIAFFSNYITSILGFHPYKEIIFLRTSHMRAMAYHLSSSKVEDLGCLPLAGDDSIKASFVYTPCWMENCLIANTEL
ncbi:hypothetical protein D1007_04413 [Hordeum vulgare]|nr:hypothetical protein D1007_04413 [Hordeum vulgare]